MLQHNHIPTALAAGHPLPTEEVGGLGVQSGLQATVADSLALLREQAEALRGVFGAEAHFAPAEVVENALAGPLTENPVVRAVMLVLFVGYVVAMLVYGGHIGGMWKIVVGRNVGIKVADEISYLFVRAMLTLSAVGVAAFALAAVKVLGMAGVEQIEGVSAEWSAPVVMLAVVGAGGVAWLLTNAMCGLVGRPEIAQGVGIISCALMGLVATIITPCVLLFAINNGTSAVIIGGVAAVVVLLGALTYVVKSFIFFVEQKISILLWFLYLCTVILIPLGVVVTTIVRNSSI